jgi:hypothetical protein
VGLAVAKLPILGVNADICEHGIVVRIRYDRRFPIRCPFRISPEASVAVTSI